MSKVILLPAQFDNYSNRKDRSASLRFITQELTVDQVSNIHGMIDAFGYLYFKAESPLTKSEKDELDALETDLVDNAKTQSKRIRNVLYRLWEQDNEGHKDFKEYYHHKTEKYIQWLKDKLP